MVRFCLKENLNPQKYIGFSSFPLKDATPRKWGSCHEVTDDQQDGGMYASHSRYYRMCPVGHNIINLG